MIRKNPCELNKTFNGDEDILGCLPCSALCLTMALKDLGIVPKVPNDEEREQGIKLINTNKNGYRTLKDMNKSVRFFLPVDSYKCFKKSERHPLKDFYFDKKAIVCVLGHYVYCDKDVYYSFFDNENDLVVAIWYLGD